MRKREITTKVINSKKINNKRLAKFFAEKYRENIKVKA